MKFTINDAKHIINLLNIDTKKFGFTPNDLLEGLNIELEHKGITKGDLYKTAKIALDHLFERGDYYKLLNSLGL